MMITDKSREWISHLVAFFHLETIRVWLPLTFVLIVILMTIAITTGNVVNGFRREQQQALNQLEVIAQLREAEIQLWTQHLQRDMSVFLGEDSHAAITRTVLQQTGANDLPASDFFARLLHPGGFEEVALIDAAGTVRLSSDSAMVGEPFPVPIYGDDERSITRSSFFAPLLNQFIFVRRIFSADGEMIGAFTGHIGLESLNDIMRGRVTADDWGQTYLVSADKVLLTQATGYSPSQLGKVQVDSAGIEAILADAGGSAREAPTRYEDYRGARVVGVAHWLPELEVSLVAERSQRQVFDSLFTTIIANSSLALSATVLAIIIGLSLTQSITNPLSYLATQAKLIAAGKLDRRIKLHREDEIGDLARAFDGMTLRLRELIGSLEQRVAERTQRLEIVASIGDRLNRILAFEELLSETVEQVRESFGYSLVQIYLVGADAGDVTLAAECAKLDGTGLSTGVVTTLADTEEIVAQAARQGEIVFRQVVPPPTQEPGASDSPARLLSMAVPITTEGNVLGILYVQDRRAQQLNAADASVLRSLTNHLGSALNNARLFEETRQRARELAEARDAAEAANRAKSTFLANMSHELRTPLNAILGFTQIMERDRRFPKKHKESLTIISRSGAHLLDLINDVLEISKIEAGQNTLEKGSFDLGHTLTNLEKMFRIRAEKKGLRLTFELAENLPHYIETDERKLRQVLINLLGNAVKFTNQGNVTLRAWAVAEDNVNGYGAGDAAFTRLYFEVEDTGPGMEADEMNRLFNAFTQTRTGQERQEGTGLGLAISYQFVQLMDGKIGVTSQVGQGATFAFNIRARVAEGCDRAYTRRVLRLESGQPDYRVLVVDDNFENRILLSKMLQSVDFSVMEAGDGEQAIELFKNWQPHLIWMDMRMPGLDGWEATKRIKSTPQGKQTPIIAVTASAFKEERTAMLAMGCDDFVGKPFQEAEIFRIMARHLDLRYVYESEAQLLPTSTPEPEERLLQTNDLVQLPQEWQHALRDVAMRGHTHQTLELIEQIASEHPQIAQALRMLVKEFRFDQIVALTSRKE